YLFFIDAGTDQAQGGVARRAAAPAARVRPAAPAAGVEAPRLQQQLDGFRLRRDGRAAGFRAGENSGGLVHHRGDAARQLDFPDELDAAVGYLADALRALVDPLPELVLGLRQRARLLRVFLLGDRLLGLLGHAGVLPQVDLGFQNLQDFQ